MKKILKHFKKNWYQYGFETLVVIFGVLIAFSLNNWNEVRKSNISKAKLLESLISEYEHNLAELKITLSVDSLLQENIIKLLGKMNSKNDDSLNYFVGWTMINSTFDPINGALRSAISSGDIHLISNKDLLANLFAWEDLINDLNEEQLLLRDEQWKMMDSFTEYYRVSDAIGAAVPNHPVVTYFPKSKFDTKNTLLTNQEFEASLYKRLHLVHSKTDELNIVIEANKKIIELLKDESR